jgi:hypothetical protein
LQRQRQKGSAGIDRRIPDITGLTDRHIATSPGRFLLKEYDPAYVLDRRPEWIVVVLTPASDHLAGEANRASTSNSRGLAATR